MTRAPDPSYPGYRRLTGGAFDAKIAAAYAMLSPCRLCPRQCRVDRANGETGFCRGGLLPRVSSFGPHFGEEPPLVGTGGSGTIFLAGCNLRCCFCQNYELSHGLEGREVPPEEIGFMMLRLEEQGCHNINLVTPTHFTPQLVEAVKVAAAEGLALPLVYNCGGYESVETLALLEGVVDIYMPDFKFASEEPAGRYANASDYPEAAKRAIREMHRQVGDLVLTDGIATRGLLVRHLVMPGHADQAKGIFDFLAREISPQTFVNVMDQYRPCYQADHFPEIARRPGRAEFAEAVELARRAGLTRVCS